MRARWLRRCRRGRGVRLGTAILAAAALLGAAADEGARGGEDFGPRLGIRGERFTIDGEPAFLLGISYYGGLGAPDDVLRRDLDEIRRRGFNWIRVWANWGAFGSDISAVDGEGMPREPHLDRLERLVAECGRRGIITDITLSRGNGVAGTPRLEALEAHRRAVETIAGRLRRRRNWYLDLSNERNIGDRRFTGFEDLRALREAARKVYPELLVTASHGGDIDPADLRQYALTARVDFIAPHRPRTAASAAETERKSREYRQALEALGKSMPLHYQEPFRRGYGRWQPAAEDFLADLEGARAGGAAGWCFHNGDQRDRKDGAPRRSFDLRERGLFDQLDGEERKFLEMLEKRRAGGTDPDKKN